MTWLLRTIRDSRSDPLTTDQIHAEICIMRRLCKADGLPSTLRDLETELAELERIGDIKRDGDFWLPVYRHPAKRVAQKALF